jgi:hypothetical protein
MSKKEKPQHPLVPGPALLAKIGSILVHVEEAKSMHGHIFDVVTIDSLMADPEVTDWLQHMRLIGMLPVKRNLS